METRERDDAAAYAAYQQVQLLAAIRGQLVWVIVLLGIIAGAAGVAVLAAIAARVTV